MAPPISFSQNSTQVCSNIAGSFECSCGQGYEGQSSIGSQAECLNINECLTDPCETENSDQHCQDTHGGFLCVCKLGFTGENGQNSVASCQNIDECSATVPPCGENQNCEDTIGGYECSCKPGFRCD